MRVENSFTTEDCDDKIRTFGRADEERTTFMRDLVSEYARLCKRVVDLEADLDSEKHSRRTFQTQGETLKQSLKDIQDDNAKRELVLVVLDGDGALFLPELLERGNDGGKEAASRIHTFVRERLRQDHKDKNTDRWIIVAHVVLNLQGLASKMLKCGVIQAAKQLAEFGHGWTSRKHFFWTDVGYGKDKADHKVTELVEFYTPVNTCKRVFFGPCSDNGFDTVLGQYKYEEDNKDKMVLIETRPAEPSFTKLGYPIVKLSHIFRDENLPDRPTEHLPTMSNGVTTTAITTPSTTEADSKGNVEQLDNSPSVGLSYSGVIRSSVQNGRDLSPNLSQQQDSEREYILVNAEDERLDRRLPAYDAVAKHQFATRTHKMKFCNDYHLHGTCFQNTACTLQHGKISEAEKLVLRHKARNIACEWGSYCRSFTCWRGHQCGYYGGPSCSTKNNDCWLSRFHGIDRRPCKKIFEDLSEQMLN